MSTTDSNITTDKELVGILSSLLHKQYRLGFWTGAALTAAIINLVALFFACIK